MMISRIQDDRRRRMTVIAMRRYPALLILGAILLCLLPTPSRTETPQTVEIITKSGIRVITAEVVASDDRIKKGLSGRKELPAGTGMLFDFRGEMLVVMETQDMLFPLDMIFIRPDGRIHKIAENAEPGSHLQIYSDGTVRGVLEVPGGTAKLLGIAVGDRVAHRIFRAGR
jgi:uncharacterized membrane protein (UPF0127 family)